MMMHPRSLVLPQINLWQKFLICIPGVNSGFHLIPTWNGSNELAVRRDSWLN